MKLLTDPYKGVRDFYPNDMAVQKKIFGIWRNVCEKFGYEEYTASVLEPSDLYKAKSGEEIVSKQTYTFKDRGDREVTLRPEMTPTVARMIAARRRELAFPVRWYSIPNFFRYEQPQRGRVREFWQLNVDIFGVESLQAEIECIQMAYEITKGYGLKDADFEILVNSRKILNYITQDLFKLDFETSQKLLKLTDRKSKINADLFKSTAQEILADDKKVATFITLLSSKNFEEFTTNLQQTKEEHEGLREVREVIDALEKLGVTNVRFDQTLTRGADYYTGVIFEVFDKNPANRRSVFGGGRYDDLLSLFGGEKVPAVGFGAGDVVAQDLMETYGTSNALSIAADIYLVIAGEKAAAYAQEVAQKLRERNIKVAVDISGKKVGEQIKSADKRKIPYVIVIGEDEMKTGEFKLKNLATGDEQIHTVETVQLK
jgi:histidyl-tRNA synthetase